MAKILGNEIILEYLKPKWLGCGTFIIYYMSGFASEGLRDGHVCRPIFMQSVKPTSKDIQFSLYFFPRALKMRFQGSTKAKM